MTTDQKLKISCLQQAKWALESAQRYIETALGTSPDDQWYSGSIKEMLAELESDMDNIHMQS